jgi:uncharacterized cupin superfamily protein
LAESKQLLRAERIAKNAQTISHPWNDKSQITGTMLGRMAGLKRAGISLAHIAPGKESFVYHSHYYEEEWIYILAGNGIAEIDGNEFEVGPGDFMGFPTPSVAHHLRNAGSEELVYLMGGENLDHEVAEFPKLGKRMIRRTAWAAGDTQGQPVVDIVNIADVKPFGPL